MSVERGNQLAPEGGNGLIETLVVMQLLLLAGLGAVLTFSATRRSLAVASASFIESDLEQLGSCHPLQKGGSRELLSCISDKHTMIVVNTSK